MVALAAAAACGVAAAQSGGPFVEGRILVMPKAGMPAHALEKVLKEHGASRSAKVGKNGLRVVELAPGQEQATVERLARHPHIKFAEVDEVVAPAAVNDPYAGSAWHLDHIGATSAWSSSTGSGVKIAIIDTGVDGTHPDLKDRMLPGYNFYSNNTDTRDVYGHGTAVAGTAAATLNNGIGVAAVAGKASIIPIRISDATGYASWSTVAKGLTWAADQGARVANISYVGVTASSSVRSAAEYMRSKGGLVVVAAGNNNKSESFPATTSMIPVSATNASDQKTSFSSWGSFVAMSAPGEGIWTTVRGGSYQTWKGTSIATPVTSAVIALMMARKPTLSGAQIEKALFDSAVDLGAAGRDAVFGYGRVDAAAALAAVDGTGTVTLTTDTTKPTVAITSPSSSATVSGLAAVGVAAADNVAVTRVDLKVNGATVAADVATPFGFSWDSTLVANGMANLVAVAYDAAGNATSSTTVSVNVANSTTPVSNNADTTAPKVAITSPASGSRVGSKVTIKVSATDDSGSAGIKQSLYIDGRLVASTTGGALSYTWNTRRVAAGTHTVKAEARDAAGNAASASISVTK